MKLKRSHAYALMLLNTMIWGAALVVVKPSLAIATPFRFLLYRYLLASLVTLPILWRYRTYVQKHATSLLTKVGLLELLGTTAALALLYLGLNQTSAIEAGLLTMTQPLLITVAGVWLLKEKETRTELAGLLIALAGTALLVLLPLLVENHQLDSVSLGGNLLVLGGVVMYMFYFPLARKYYKKFPKLLVASLSFWVGLVSFLGLSMAELQFSVPALVSAVQADLQHAAVWWAAGYMAILGSVLALTAYIRAQDAIESSEASLFTYLQPLVYIPLGILLLGESIVPLQLGALLLIGVGVFVAEKRWR